MDALSTFSARRGVRDAALGHPLGMLDLRRLVESQGGLAPTFRLVELGATRAAIAWANGHGVIRRVRKGWYCLPETRIEFQQAARVGGRLTEVSAAAACGVWAPPTSALHVAVPANACRLRERDSYVRRLSAWSNLPVEVHWNDTGGGDSRFVVPARDWLREVVTRRPFPIAAAVADSALRAGAMDRFAWEELRLTLADGLVAATAVVDGTPETGTESIVRAALFLVGVPCRTQVSVTRGVRVDLLIGDRLVIEAVSEAHHGSRDQRLRDLERTAVLTRLGYHVLEFDYAQIMFALDDVVTTILAVIARGGHIRS